VRGGDRARLEVEDNGVGVAAGERARVVEPFVRLDSTRSSSGAGLGLSIVAAIAKLHDAEFGLEDANPGLRAVLTWR
jgi:signal transduction histidine kinase